MSLEQFKIICKKWKNYYIFGREPEEGIKKLLFSINDLHNELLESGAIKKEYYQDEFNDLVLSYVFEWNSKTEQCIDIYINNILNSI